MSPPLADVVFHYPAIDNHAHPLLAQHNRHAFPPEGIVSEASGVALTRDSRYTLANYQATAFLSSLFRLHGEPSWDAVKKKRDEMDYVELCKTCFEPAGIQCILLDDGLGGSAELAESIQWHDQFTTSPCKRIVRIETEAENILRTMLDKDTEKISTSIVSVVTILEDLIDRFKAAIAAHAQDDHVAGFKSVICYRTGLDITPSDPATYDDVQNAVLDLLLQYKASGSLRLNQKELNDCLVDLVLQIAGQYHKPVQFHTGLGDNDIRLTKSSPAHMQPIIEAHPQTPIVLLHAAYPYTREAGYLTSMYENVYLDFGEVFPCLSHDGQRAVLRQVLELAPTNKILWSSDGHWWPETYYLGCRQARHALFEILEDCTRRREITPQQAVEIAQNTLFHNANRLYNLGLEPDMSLFTLIQDRSGKPGA